MFVELGWQSLEERRRIHRLTSAYGCGVFLQPVDAASFFKGLPDTAWVHSINAGSILRSNGSHRIYQPSATQPLYKYSFYSRTIQDWNRLPATATDSQTLEEFVAAIQAPLAAVIFVAPYPEGDGCPILLTRWTVQSTKTPDLFFGRRRRIGDSILLNLHMQQRSMRGCIPHSPPPLTHTHLAPRAP